VNGSIRAIGSVYYGGSTTGIGTAYTKPDFVFNDNYKVIQTEEVDEYVKKENHLPWITSAEQETKENGTVTDMTRMSFETLEAVENLQLQLIGQQKLIRELQTGNDKLMSENSQQKARIESLESRLLKLESMLGAISNK
jgi:hypothetical protein